MAQRRVWGAIRDEVTPSIRPARLMLALKTAIAAGLAWPVAQLLPGAVDEYSYYAPLGALISMMPTLMGSLRASVQTVLGIAIGIGLSWLVIFSPLHAAISVPLTVGIGILLGGLRGLGAGRDYVPIAALFVLVVGGAHAEDYSVGFLVQMAVGMAIGVVVNLVIAPPLHLRRSAEEVEDLRMQVAGNLDSMANAMTEAWPPDDQDWYSGIQSLDSAIRAAEPVIEDAQESRRLNPRSRWHGHDLQRDYDDLSAITALGRDIRDLGESISGAIWADPVPVELPETVREPLGAALARAGDLVRAWGDRDGGGEAADQAEQALARLHEAAREHPDGESPEGALGTIMFSLRRAIAAVRERIDAPSA